MPNTNNTLKELPYDKYSATSIFEYSNKAVYKFLIEECKTMPSYWEEFGTGLTEHTDDADFWDRLSEELDCFRICDECGKPMIEGFVVDGCNTYCSEECLHKHISEEEYREAYNNGDGDTYWTTWYEDSNTYNKKMKIFSQCKYQE